MHCGKSPSVYYLVGADEQRSGYFKELAPRAIPPDRLPAVQVSRTLLFSQVALFDTKETLQSEWTRLQLKMDSKSRWA